MHVTKEQPVKRLINDIESRQSQQAGLHEGREVLELSVTIGVFLIRRLVRHAHGEKRDDRRKQVKTRVQGFRKNTQASRPHHQKRFERD